MKVGQTRKYKNKETGKVVKIRKPNPFRFRKHHA